MLEVRNLSKSFGGNTILSDVSFSVEKGESVVIIGGSGCGKSTLLRCLNRLVIPEKGEILFNGKNILDKKTDINAYRCRVGMVYQHFNLFSHLNIMENMILAPMTVLHMSEKEAVERAEELLCRVGMENRRLRMPDALSGGQKQRVAIARTLMMQPDMILFDEPTSALDPTMVDEVETVIRRLIEGGMTAVIVTHEMRFAKSIANKVLFLAEQGIYEQGSPERIFDEPQKELTRRFIYRSRLFSRRLYAADTDCLALSSEMRAFVTPYGCTRIQAMGISYVTEELLLPVLRLPDCEDCNLSLACNENGIGHKLILEFTGLQSDPLTGDTVNELGMKLIERYTQSVTSCINTDGKYEITVLI